MSPVGRPVASASSRGVPRYRLRNRGIYTARFELYGAYPGPPNGPPFGRTGNVGGNMHTEGYNAGGAIPKLPNGSSGSAYGGDRSDLKMISQLASTSACFDSSILPDGSRKGKIQQWLKVVELGIMAHLGGYPVASLDFE